MADLTVFYDGACSLCRASADRVRRMDKRHRVELIDLHDPSVASRFPQIDNKVATRWMQAVDDAGHVSSGSAAWARIGMLLPGWNLVAWLVLVPGIRWVASKVYAWIADNRYRWSRSICADGTCSIHEPGAFKGFHHGGHGGSRGKATHQ